LKPDVLVRDGHKFTRRDLQHWGPPSCFAQTDLYTVKWGKSENVEIEKFFFGKIDHDGPAAIDYFTNFQHPSANSKAFEDLMTYMSVQKLRTPKGLRWLSQISRLQNRYLDLIYMQRVQNLFCAIWTECVWQIADATISPTKFIISDHPVTVYNRACFPGSGDCIGFNDPDIRWVGTHTFFPLSIDRLLILTNLAWVRNPYQREKVLRPNPTMLRPAMFKFTSIQTYRSLSEDEVLQINYITKKRALRYVAGADKEWLHPERHLKSTHWSKFGEGYLLMPEPRGVYMGGEILIGYKDGRHDAFSEYGHKLWQKGYEDQDRFETEAVALERFKSAFAQMLGPAWRGTSHDFHQTGPRVDSESMHQHYLEGAKKWHRKKSGYRS
jgi:hypothetical protein